MTSTRPKINKKLEKVSFMKEPGRKLFVYDSLCQEGLNWQKLRSCKRSFLTGARITMICETAGQSGRDTLATLKDVYLNYRTTREPDDMSEDIVAAIVPGVTQDKPTNEYLDAAWRSLKALGNKHMGPRIGQIVQNKQSLLQQVYTRSVWSRTPDHHLVFTYQTMPRDSSGRKRMKYLQEGGNYGDTAFNCWPVPMVPMAGLPKATQQVHDDIFENDTVEDSGAEDGTGGAAVEDLGDKVIPFPREMSESLTREMFHVFAIDVGIFLTPASGKALMAVILENRRAVAICKNKAHKDFIMHQLLEMVKALNLAADKRPAKPQELVEWESTHGRTGQQAAIPNGGGRAGGAFPPTPVAPLLGAGGAGGAVPLPAPKAAVLPLALPPPILPSGGAPSSSGAPPPPAATGLAAFGAAVLR